MVSVIDGRFGIFDQVSEKISLVLIATLFWLGMNTSLTNMGGSGVQIPYNMFSWLVASALVFVSVIRVILIGQIRIHQSSLYYGFFVVMLLIPLLYTDLLFLDVEVLRLAGIAGGILFFLSLQQYGNVQYKGYIVLILFGSTLIQTVLGLVQYYISVDDAWFTIMSAKYRPYGIFQQVNVFSIYLAAGNLLGLYLANIFYSAKSREFLIAAALLLFLNFHLTVLSGAGTATVVSIVSLIIYLVHLIWVRACSKRLLLFFAAAAFLGGFSASSLWSDMVTLSSADQKLNAENSSMILDNSASDGIPHSASSVSTNISESEEVAGESLSSFGTRPTIYAASLEMFFDEPFFGHGIGSFAKQYLLYQGEFLKANPRAGAEFRLSHPHNEPLYWAVELGIVSALAFVLLLFIWLVSLMRGAIDASIFFAATPFLLHSLLELPFYHSVPHFLAFFVLLVAAMNEKFTKVFRVSRWSALVVLPAAIGVLVKTWIFLLSTYYALSMFLIFNAGDRADISALRNINNPAAFKLRYEFELFQWQFRQAQEQGAIDLENLNAFLAWAYSTIQYDPLESTYENFISALVLVGNEDVAREYLDEALLIYPRNEKFKVYDEQLRGNSADESQ